jgi:riboflavin kinase/FMN adenylyltransferase
MAAVSLDGKQVSSTRIRETIRVGNLDAAGQMLGRAWSLAGNVVRGDRRGHELGFPTANIDASGLVLPPNGVYAARALVEGRQYRVAVNIGVRPTMKDAVRRVHVEAHLLDFKGELYDKELEITFIGRLREEKKFSSLAALREQIAVDISAVRTL